MRRKSILLDHIHLQLAELHNTRGLAQFWVSVDTADPSLAGKDPAFLEAAQTNYTSLSPITLSNT